MIERKNMFICFQIDMLKAIPQDNSIEDIFFAKYIIFGLCLHVIFLALFSFRSCAYTSGIPVTL